MSIVKRAEDEERAGLSLARYAEVWAEIRWLGRARQSEILARAGVPAGAWDEADAAWAAAIDADVDGTAGYMLAFAARFRAARRILATAPSSTAREAVPEQQAPEAGAKTEEQLPTFMTATPPPAARLNDVTHKPFAATADLDIRAIVARALPFEEGNAPPRIAEPAAKPSTPAPRAFSGTADLDIQRLGAQVLAFGPTPAPPPRARSIEPAEPSEPEAASSKPVLAQTAAFDIRAIVPNIMPFGAPAAPEPPSSVPELTLEQYASLAAEIAAAPERLAETRAKYGVLTEQAHRALSASWQQRFATDGALEQRYSRLVAEYRAWLAQRR